MNTTIRAAYKNNLLARGTGEHRIDRVLVPGAKNPGEALNTLGLPYEAGCLLILLFNTSPTLDEAVEYAEQAFAHNFENVDWGKFKTGFIVDLLHRVPKYGYGDDDVVKVRDILEMQLAGDTVDISLAKARASVDRVVEILQRPLRPWEFRMDSPNPAMEIAWSKIGLPQAAKIAAQTMGRPHKENEWWRQRECVLALLKRYGLNS